MTLAAMAQPKLIVNEFSQGSGGNKEFIELLVVGTRNCNDTAMDLRLWIFDDHNGWYGGAGTGIAAGHFRFKDDPNWASVPYGSIILIYNNDDRNLKIPAGANDPTDANGDGVYILPISSSYIEQNLNEPVSPSTTNYVYPTSGYGSTTDWVPIGLANGGDAVIIVDPAQLGTAHFSVQFGFNPVSSGQTPTVNLGPVGSGANAYVNGSNYNLVSGWTVGTANTTDETPGAPNNPANEAWIASMKVDNGSAFPVTAQPTHPTCTSPLGSITVTDPVGADYTYSLDGTNYTASPEFNNLPAGDYTVYVQNAGGCVSTTTVTLTNSGTVPPAPTVTSPVVYCLNETATALTATGDNLLWFTGATGGTGSSIAPTPSTTATGSTSYYVSQTVNGCESDRAEIVVNVRSLDVPGITGASAICLVGNNTITLNNSVAGGVWSSSNTGVAEIDNNGVVTSVGVGTTTIAYTVTDGTCTESVTVDIEVRDFQLQLNANPNPVATGSNVVLQTSSNETYTVSEWLPSALFTQQTALNQTITLNADTYIEVIATNNIGCVDTASITVTVTPTDEEIYIPNAFTPNGDGVNDIFKAYGNSIQSVELSIFNQWGEQIYHSSNGTLGWDGKHKGKLQPSGVYVYVMRITLLSGTQVNKKGSVNLIR